jgi:hypothetical protein
MAYGNESWVSLPLVPGVVVSTDWGITGAKLDTISAGEAFAVAVVPYSKCILKRVGFTVGTVAAGTTSTPTIKVWEGTIASGTLRATLTVGTTAAGNCVYEDPSSSIEFEAGDIITFELDVADVGGTPTSEGFPFVCVEPAHEVPGNISTMTAG